MSVETIPSITSPESEVCSPESRVSTALRPERSSSSLFRISCHRMVKILIEYEREMIEIVRSMGRRILDLPASGGDSGGVWGFS